MDFFCRPTFVAAVLIATFSGHAQAEPPTASFPLLDPAPAAPPPASVAPAPAAPPPHSAPSSAPPRQTAPPSAAPVRAAWPSDRTASSVAAPNHTTAAPVAGPSDWAAPSVAGEESQQPPGAVGADVPPASTQRDVRDDWVVSIEGVTRAPVDIGFLAGLEVPGRVHVHAGYGWVPSPYVGLIAGRIGADAAADSSALGIIRDGFDSGHAWRVQAGIRPFRNLGLYLDAGYARITLNGSLDTSLASSFAPVSVNGAYSVETALDTWFVELGYLARVGRHVLLGGGLGLMGTMSAETRIAANDARLPQADPQIVQDVNDKLERYGYLPTLSLRGGFDLY